MENSTLESNHAQNDVFLVVDDDIALTQVLERALKRRGHSVFTAHNIEAAVSVCAEHLHITKAVVDLKIEHESGLRLIPQLLQINSGLQIVVLTGYSSIATAVEAIKLGALNYLCKPADANEILAGFHATGINSVNSEAESLQAPSLDRVEWEHIQKVLQENDGNVSATARALNMHRRTLQRKLNKYPVRR